MSRESSHDLLLGLLKQEARIATTCTEPGAVALATAKARQLAGGAIEGIEVEMSPDVMKNCLYVGLPLTSKRGPDQAAALGAVGGKPELDLEVLRDVSPGDVEEANRLLDAGKVKSSCRRDSSGVYVRSTVTGEKVATVVIENGHAQVAGICVDGTWLDMPGAGDGPGIGSLKDLSFQDIFTSLEALGREDLDFLLEGSRAIEDLASKVLKENEQGDRPDAVWAPRDVLNDTISKVLAAVSARMNGTVWPVLTSGGSGNQGITTALPIMQVASRLGAPEERVKGALFIAHMTNLFIKAYCGKTSPFCGAVPASAGVAAATCWLLGGSPGQVEAAVQSVLGTLYGMFCDGAKSSCAAKCAAGAVQGLMSGRFALDNRLWVRPGEGLVGESLDATLQMLESLQREATSVNQALMKAMARWKS